MVNFFRKVRQAETVYAEIKDSLPQPVISTLANHSDDIQWLAKLVDYQSTCGFKNVSCSRCIYQGDCNSIVDHSRNDSVKQLLAVFE